MHPRRFDPFGDEISTELPVNRLRDDVLPARWEGSAAILFDEFVEPRPAPRHVAAGSPGGSGSEGRS